jgi:hypothetical protein
MFSKVFENFINRAPIAVIARATLERVLSPHALNKLYDEVVETQYTRGLLFSSVSHLMNLVVCRVRPSIHAACQDKKEEIETSVTAGRD